jgi:hypothetical protein
MSTIVATFGCANAIVAPHAAIAMSTRVFFMELLDPFVRDEGNGTGD